jgi:hypothetical protein
MRIRPIHCIALTAALALAGTAAAVAQGTTQGTKPQAPAQGTKPPAAQPQTAPKFETYTATTANLSVGAGQKIKINVLRWATDEDRNKAITSFKEKGEKQLLEAFQSQPSAGYVWTDETLGYSVRYAHRQSQPDGGERIVLFTDRPLGSWSGKPWKAAAQVEGADYPFTLVELRLNRAGTGEGKMSLAGKVTVDQEGKTLALENYQSAPVLLRGVKHEAPTGGN